MLRQRNKHWGTISFKNTESFFPQNIKIIEKQLVFAKMVPKRSETLGWFEDICGRFAGKGLIPKNCWTTSWNKMLRHSAFDVNKEKIRVVLILVLNIMTCH